MKTLNMFVLKVSFLTLALLVALVTSVFSVENSADDIGKKTSTRYDFDGDGKADLSVFLPASGKWLLDQSERGYSEFQIGQEGDIPVAADYDGDGKTDLAFFREGSWYRLKSSTNTFDTARLGMPEDIPAPADFDGDGLADLTIFRPSTGQWLMIPSTDETNIKKVDFGQKGDIPAAADYDGDSRADIAVFRPSNGTWYRLGSADDKFEAVQFGQSEDLPFPADFDGDGKADIAVWRSTDANWFIRQTDGSQTNLPLGQPTDFPIPADYDGDGKTDVAVWRNSENTLFSFASSDGAPEIRQPRNITDAQRPTSPDVLSGSPTPTPAWKRKPKATPTPVTPPSSLTCDYVASPSGTSTGTGSNTSPWNLQTALIQTGLITSGKTLCLRGGTYYGKFISSLTGGNVRSYPGEWAVIDGYLTTTLVSSINSSQTTLVLASIEGLTSGKTFIIDSEMIRVATTPTTTTVSVNRGWGSTTPASHSNGALAAHYGTQLSVTGSNTRYQGFEIKNSCPTRDDSHILASTSGLGFLNNGNGNEFINLLIHDNGNGGIFTGSTSSNTLLYGNLVYNNGVYNAPRGHGLYLENASGYSRVYENVVLNNFNLGGQFYGVSGPYVGGDTQGLVMSNTSPSGQTRGNLLFGPNSVESPTGSIADSVFYHNNPAAYNVNFGYESGVGTGTVTNNYFLGGAFAFQATNVDHLTFTGNKFDSPSGVAYASAKAIGYTWNNNTYYRQSAGNDTRLVNSSIFEYRNFATWKAETGYDANSTINSGAMPDTVIIRPNAYESGRANITIYTPSAPSSINVDLSTSGLTNGQSYTIKNAFNYFGSDVATGTYNASSPIVAVPLNGAAKSVASPIGMLTAPGTTAPYFFQLILLPR